MDSHLSLSLLTMRRAFFLFVAVGMLLAAGGCATGRGGNIRLESADRSAVFASDFANAFFAVSKEGAFDILMVDNDSAWQFKKAAKKGAIQPIEITPVRQALLIHSNWSHKVGSKPSAASANASLAWYILGENGDHDLLLYQGVAHVEIGGDANSRDCSVVIRDGTLEASLVAGSMQDPVGFSTVTGHCRAVRQEGQLRDILADMDSHRLTVEKAVAAGR
jgi:hypothetical protein